MKNEECSQRVPTANFTFHFSPHTQAHSLGYTFHFSLFTTYPSSFAWLHFSPHTQAHSLGYTLHFSLFTLHSKCFTLIIFFFLLLRSPSSGMMAHGRRVPSRAPLPVAACRRPIARGRKYLWPIASTIMYRPPMPPSAASPMWCTSPAMPHTSPRAPLSLLPTTPKATTPVAAPSYRNTTKDSYIIESFYNDQ